jgi:hypothetical protein
MNINNDIKHLPTMGKCDKKIEININGIPTIFQNIEFKYLQTVPDFVYAINKEWCIKNIVPYMTRKSFNEKISSYQLKHIVEREIRKTHKHKCWYVSNAEIKYILSELGYWHNPKRHYEFSYNYNLSEKFKKAILMNGDEK